MPVLGVAMLDTGFPRPPGDIGNPESFGHPAIYERVARARVADAVRGGRHDALLIDGFVEAARRLRRRGADVIATSCGFLAPLQDAMQDAVDAPVVSSVLIDLPEIREAVGAGAPLGVLTFDSRRLGAAHLPPVHGPYRVAGLEGGRTLFPAIAGDLPDLDPEAAAQDAETAALALVRDNGAPGAVVLECTNLPPYRRRIEAAAGAPCYSILDAIAARIRMFG